VYEQDTCAGDPIDDARISFRFLEKNLLQSGC